MARRAWELERQERAGRRAPKRLLGAAHGLLGLHRLGTKGNLYRNPSGVAYKRIGQGPGSYFAKRAPSKRTYRPKP